MAEREQVAELSAGQLAEEIVALVGRLSSGTYELLVLVGELDARGSWAATGALSCAAWLAEACDIDTSTARTQVRVARAMRAFPALDAAMGEGEVSYAKARVLVPHLTEDNVGVLVELSSCTPAGQLGAAIAAWSRRHEDPDDIDLRHRRERSVSWRTDPDGMVTLTARLTPHDAARLTAVIDHQVMSDHVPAGASLAQQRADALVEVVSDGGGSVTAEVVIHVRGDAPTLLADGTPISDHAVAGLLPESFVSLLICDSERYPIDASPRRRSPTRRQRRVLDERHRHCARDGCGATRFLHSDHIVPYAPDGPTVLANLQLLCGPHNRERARGRERPRRGSPDATPPGPEGPGGG